MRYSLVLLAVVSLPAAAQTPREALAARWNTICATASTGLLLVRCTETATSSDPFANLTAARGQHLEEIPGQARVATRGTELQPGGFHVELSPQVSLSGRDDPLRGLSLNLKGDLAARWSLFASVDAGRLDRQRGQNEAAFGANTLNLIAGVNVQPSERWLFGVAVDYNREDLDFSATVSRAKAHYTGLVATASYNASDAWVFDGYVGRLQGGFDLVRSVKYVLPVIGGGQYLVDTLAFASPDSHRTVGGVASSWNWARAGWQGDVTLGYDLTSTTIAAYTENGGGGLALDVPGRTVKTRRGRIDATVGRAVSANWGVWQPSVRLGWRQEFSNKRRLVTLGLAEDQLDNPITFDTEDPDPGWGEFGVGSVFTFTGGKSAFFEYRQRFAHDFLQERVLALGFRLELQ